MHLIKKVSTSASKFTYEGDGDDVVRKPKLDGARIWINDTQFFDTVPPEAWECWIGGYQPAQKWLKDRKGLSLTFDNIRHYQTILDVLSETRRIMPTILL